MHSREPGRPMKQLAIRLPLHTIKEIDQLLENRRKSARKTRHSWYHHSRSDFIREAIVHRLKQLARKR